MEILWETTDEIAADEDVHNTADERYLLPQGDCLCIVPMLAQLVNTASHLLPVAIELFISRGNTTPPLLYHALPSELCLRLECISRPADLVSLGGDSLLELLKLLRQSKVVEKIKDCKSVEWWKGVPIIVVGAASREGGIP